MADGILGGLRVVDLSSAMSGPIATQILAECGAEVVKVERPGGDPLRRSHPAAFATWNRSKRSVVIDLDDPAGLERLHGLIAGADVLVHDRRPSAAAGLGIDDATLSARHPRLVICGITAYQVDHVDGERRGYDLQVQARGGLMDYQGCWREGPFAFRFFVPSWFAAALAVTGIAARLYRRERDGVGGVAHTSLMQGLRLAENMNWVRAERPPASIADGPSATMRVPQVATYQCADGEWIQILDPGGRTDFSQLPLTVEAIEQLGLTDAPFDADVFTAALTQFPSDRWLDAIRAIDVAVEHIAPLGGLLSHAESVVNGYVVEVDDAVFGETVQAAHPFQLDPPMSVRWAAPRLGEHDDDLGAFAAGEPTPTPATATVAVGAPLEGVKVLDLGAFLAGPMAPMLLGDLGAEVIKIELITGDPVRGWRDEFYIACNRGKRGLAMDITTPDGQEILQRLIAWADVVHHNIRSGPSSRLGLDQASLRGINERVILGHVSAYGSAGERASWPGYDSVFQALAGWNIELAGEGNPPMFNHIGNLDTLTATFSAAATVLALYHRERTGTPTAVRGSLLNTATYTNGETLLIKPADTLADYPHLDHEQTGLGPGYRIYRCRDGWFAVTALTAAHLAALERVAGGDPGVALSERFAGRSVADVISDLDHAGVPVELVREQLWRVVFDDPANVNCRQVVSYEQADWGRMEQFGAFWCLGDAQLHLDRACPAVGQHTAEILDELGYDAPSRSALAARGVIGGAGLLPAP